MSLSMIKCISEINREKSLELNRRIIIHTGVIVVGITGTKIVRHVIYGPEVDIANKIKSRSKAVSEITNSILEKECLNRFAFVYNKDITYKPVDNTLQSFFLEENQ